MASLTRLIRRHRTLHIYQTIQSIEHPSLRCVSRVAHVSTSAQDLSPITPPPPQDHDIRKWRWSSLFLFLPGAITFGLGTWQLFRRQEKIEQLEYRKKRLEMEPINLNKSSSQLLGSIGDCDPSSLEFRRVTCEGVFDESKSIFVGPRSRSISGVVENGYYVLTPLLLTKEPGSVQLAVLVNRGWVPRNWRNKFLEDSSTVREPPNVTTADVAETKHRSWWKFWSKQLPVCKDNEHHSEVKVHAVVRGSENPSIFVPANDPSTGQWFYVDVPASLQDLGLPKTTLYVEDINDNVSASNPYPVPKDVNSLIHHSVMPRDHLNYTFTWYSLSAAVTYMAVKRIFPKKVRR